MQPFDPSMNIFTRRSSQLDLIFRPKTVAVVGATEKEGSVGRTVMQNLMAGSSHELFPVSLNRPEILGLKAYPNLKSIGKKVDLVVVVTPAKAVPAVISECADLGIGAAIIISAGFKEMGESGLLLEQEILKHARRGKMRIVGPNCLGVMNPNEKLNATFAAGIAHPGSVAFISQSGALCTAVLDWSLRENVGFSAFVSIGSMVDVNWGDLIDYFGSDPDTKSILIYMESIGDARAFLSAAREVALSKPIILIKAGRSEESAKAAASHTGALAGGDEAFTAALRRVGVLRVDTIADLFNMADVLSKQPLPKGPRLMIVTNAGGPGVIATDALISGNARLAEIAPQTMEALNAILPAPWSHNNPVDVLGDASADIYAKTIEILSQDPNTDGTLVILTPQAMTEPTATAEKLETLSHTGKPILASWMGADSVRKGCEQLTRWNIPNFEFPDDACKTFAAMWRYSEHLKSIYETPMSVPLSAREIEPLLTKVRSQGRVILDEVESKQVLEAYGIPCVPTRAAFSPEEAAKLAEEMSFPVVVKLYSHTITHKSDVGGVKLNLKNSEEVKKAYREIHAAVQSKDFLGVTVQPMIKLDGYELILGSSLDADFGPVLLFGSGGQLVEVYKDSALAIPPLTTTLARRLMERTKIYAAFQGVRGKKEIDLKKLEQILVQFSNLVAENPWIKECDINPLVVSSEKMMALDARVILHEPDTKELPRPAIRPYPVQYIEKWDLGTIRPIKPEDERLLHSFHKDLSQETVRQRYLKVLQYDERTAHERLIRICFNDYDRELALLVENNEEILGMIRLSKIPGTQDASFTLMVKDKWQNKGIGSKLLGKILEVASQEKVKMVRAQMLEENQPMQKLCKRFGFSLIGQAPYVFAEKLLK